MLQSLFVERLELGVHGDAFATPASLLAEGELRELRVAKWPGEGTGHFLPICDLFDVGEGRFIASGKPDVTLPGDALHLGAGDLADGFVIDDFGSRLRFGLAGR